MLLMFSLKCKSLSTPVSVPPVAACMSTAVGMSVVIGVSVVAGMSVFRGYDGHLASKVQNLYL